MQANFIPLSIEEYRIVTMFIGDFSLGHYYFPSGRLDPIQHVSQIFTPV